MALVTDGCRKNVSRMCLCLALVKVRACRMNIGERKQAKFRNEIPNMLRAKDR